MKKILIVLGLLLLAGGLPVSARLVQGRPHPAFAGDASDNPYERDPIDMGSLDYGEIKFWTGTGTKRCRFVIEWELDEARYAYVFGYRWDGTAYGEDVLRAVVREHPQLYGVITPGTEYGITLNGLGWDPARDGNFTLTLAGSVYAPDENGMLYLDAGDCDRASATNSDDWFQGGWYKGYWSYWVNDGNDNKLRYSQLGASSRELADGCTDAWIFALDMEPPAKMKAWAPAPAADEIVDPSQLFNFGVLPGESKTVEVLPRTGGEPYSGAIEIPGTIKKNGEEFTVAAVGDNAFDGCADITSVTLPATIRRIGDRAFRGCTAVEELILPDGLETIGEEAFRGMTSLRSVGMPGSVTEVGDAVFAYCRALTKVSCQSEFLFSDGYALYSADRTRLIGYYPGRQHKYYEIPETVTAVSHHAFAGANGLQGVLIPAALAEIGTGAFDDCRNLAGDIVMPSGVKTLPAALFQNCAKLHGVVLPDVTVISECCFLGCSGIKSLVLPKTVVSIEARALSGCSGLTGLTLPESVRHIANEALAGCLTAAGSTLTACMPIASISGHVAEPEIFGTSTNRLYRNCRLLVPAADFEAYRTTDPWKNFKAIEIDRTSGIDDPGASAGGDPEYFDLLGRRVDNPSGGIYLERRGATVRKVSIR